MTKNVLKRITSAALLSFLAACSGGGNGSNQNEGNALLGIAKFAVTDDGHSVSISGVDADGNSVAQIDLYQGAFTMSDDWVNNWELKSPQVNGRKFAITVHDASKPKDDPPFVWETPEFAYQVRLPLPMSAGALYTLVNDPQVKPYFDRASIRFRYDGKPYGGASSVEEYYYTNQYCWLGGSSGTNPVSNDGANTIPSPGEGCDYGSSSSGSPNSVCAAIIAPLYGGINPGYAGVVVQDGSSQDYMTRVCTGNGSANNVGLKTCYRSSTCGTAGSTDCGSASVCNACAGYQWQLGLSYGEAGAWAPYVSSTGYYQICIGYN